MIWVFWIVRVALLCQLPADPLPLVFNDGRTLFNGFSNEYAFTVNR